jgi:hypothetical protein
MDHRILKFCHICPFLRLKYKIFCIENFQTCSVYRLLHVGIIFENIWCFFKNLKTGSLEPVLQSDFLHTSVPMSTFLFSSEAPVCTLHCSIVRRRCSPPSVLPHDGSFQKSPPAAAHAHSLLPAFPSSAPIARYGCQPPTPRHCTGRQRGRFGSHYATGRLLSPVVAPANELHRHWSRTRWTWCALLHPFFSIGVLFWEAYVSVCLRAQRFSTKSGIK